MRAASWRPRRQTSSKTLPGRQEETQKHLNELSAQLRESIPTRRAKKDKHMRYEAQCCSSIVRRVRREWRRPCLTDELCSESYIRCNDGQMVRSMPETCSCVTADLSDSDTSELRLNAWKSSPCHSQPVGPSGKPLINKASTEGSRTFGRRPDARKSKSPLSSC